MAASIQRRAGQAPQGQKRGSRWGRAWPLLLGVLLVSSALGWWLATR